jgi:hypothetical protein
MSLNIICPSCHQVFDASTAVQQHVEGAVAERLSADRSQIAKREQALKEREENQDRTLQQKLDAERNKVAKEAEARAQKDFELKLKEQTDAAATLRDRLRAAEERELDVRKLKQEVEEQASRQALELQQKLDAERAKVAKEAEARVQKDFELKLKDQTEASAALRERLRAAEQRELEVRKLKQEVEEQASRQALELQQKLDTERTKVAKEAEARAQKDFELKLKEQADAAATLRDRLRAAEERELEVRKLKKEVEEQASRQALELQQKLDAERTKVAKEAEARAQKDFELKLKDQTEASAALREKLRAAEQRELDVRKLKQEVEEQASRQALELQQKLDAERVAIRAAADKEAAERATLKQREADELNRQLREQLADAQRKLLQGSQQLQGEAQELVLEQALQGAFPRDAFTPVEKGVDGADVLQTVRDDRGRDCGTILWESKRTRNWSETWIGKLAADRARENATVAALATQALPKEVQGIGQVGEVWVCAFGHAVVLAALLRRGMLEAAQARQAEEGRADKTTQLYRYLTGPEFRSRALAMGQALQQMREDLDREQKAMEKIWARRRSQLAMAIGGITGMQGDLQAIAGAELVALPCAEDGLEDLEFLTDSAVPAPAGDDEALQRTFLEALRASGGTSGNKALRTRLAWDEASYDRIKGQLLARSEIVLGMGRGGSVRLPLGDSADA